MSDRLRCNVTQHCSLCPSESASGRNWLRVYIGTPRHSMDPQIAICPVHDIVGSVGLLPESLRVVLDRRHA